MNCEQYESLIQEYHDGHIGDESSQSLFRHVSECHSCRSFFRAYSTMVSEFHVLQSVPVPKSLDQRIQTMLHDSSTDRREGLLDRILHFKLTLTTPAIAALFLVLLLGSVLTASAVRTYFDQQHTEVVYVMELPQVVVQGTYYQ